MRQVFLALALIVIAGCSETAHEAKQAVKAKLKDPESAEWRDLTYDGRDNVCGYVNSRNSFGGYVGFRRFRYLLGMVWIEDEPGTPEGTFDDCPKGRQAELPRP